MQFKSLLNRVHPVKRFVYEKVQLVEEPEQPNGVGLEVHIRPRQGSRGMCGGCGRPGPGYDRLDERRFAFVPVWGIAVTLIYAMRRINCQRCGKIHVERVPWAEGKRPITRAYECFLATWAKRMSWSEVGSAFWVSWECVFRSVKTVVDYGLAHRDLTGINAIGVDEVAYAKGHRYATLVYQLDGHSRRLLHVVEGRTARRRKNLSGKQRYRLRNILQWDLRTVRAYLLKESLNALWEYKSPTYAGRCLDAWCRQAMRSRLEPMKKVARSLRNHRELILNWFHARRQYNSGVVEGMNTIVKLRFRQAFGFRTFDGIEVALYHQLGALPEPEIAHRFC